MISYMCWGRHLNLQENGSLSYSGMEDSHMAARSHIKWYLRESIRKPKVLVKTYLFSGKHPVQKETAKEKLQKSTVVQ